MEGGTARTKSWVRERRTEAEKNGRSWRDKGSGGEVTEKQVEKRGENEAQRE